MRETYRGGVEAGKEGWRWRRETKWIVLLQIQFLIAGGREGGWEEGEKKTVKERGEGEGERRYHV